MLTKSLVQHDFDLASTPEILESFVKSIKYDVIVVVGWSWKISEDIVNNNLVIGIQPIRPTQIFWWVTDSKSDTFRTQKYKSYIV